MDVTFQAELESLFRTTFLQAAPLYQASGKFKLPYEDIKKVTTLHRGSLHEVVRTVEEIADYEIAKGEFTNGFARSALAKLATAAGTCVDGLIRLENVRSHRDHDPRNTMDMKVIDIFDHADGRRNLQIMSVTPKEWNPADPFNQIPGWVAYRFYFACAVVSTEYKKP
jgi:hypothetical protein